MEYIIVLTIIVVILNQPIVKGMIGELAVNIMLKRLDKDEYTLYKDLYIPKKDGTTSQVDHVVVSKYGVFVIETKNYKGWIFGNETGKNWMQIIYTNKQQFFNPIIQNKGHIKSLVKISGLDKKKFVSIISFSLRGTLKKIDTTTPVVYSVGLTRRIKKYTEVILSSDEISAVSDVLSKINKPKLAGKIEHVKNVNKVIEKSKSICPKCGSDLVERNGKRGKFLGCSSFPKCKYTGNVE